MKHKNTGCYLQSRGCWTDHLDAALRFNSALRLVQYVERGGLRERPELLEVVAIPPAAAAPRCTA